MQLKIKYGKHKRMVKSIHLEAEISCKIVNFIDKYSFFDRLDYKIDKDIEGTIKDEDISNFETIIEDYRPNAGSENDENKYGLVFDFNNKDLIITIIDLETNIEENRLELYINEENKLVLKK